MDNLILDSEIHVWIIGNDISIPYNDMIDILCAEEKIKAGSFVFEKDKVNFVKTRFCIRLALSYYLNLELKEINFVYNEYDKPRINPTISNIPINFSISHSNGLIVFAFQQNQEIGVDIEYVDNKKIDELLYDESILSVEEIELMKSERPDCREKLFYKLWTCKESYLKALGIGLNMPLKQIRIVSNLSSVIAVDYNAPMLSKLKYNKCNLIDLKNLPREYVGTIASPNANFSTIQYINQDTIQNTLDKILHRLEKLSLTGTSTIG